MRLRGRKATPWSIKSRRVAARDGSVDWLETAFEDVKLWWEDRKRLRTNSRCLAGFHRQPTHAKFD